MSARTAAMGAVLLLGLATQPALAAGKGEGSGGGDSLGGMWASLPGTREMEFKPPQASESLGNVTIASTMWAGTGSAKCRVNFVIENYSTANVALGFIARTFDAKDLLVDNFVVSVATLAPGARTGRLFSCILGATQLTLVPTAGYDWPPAKCVKGEESEPCPLTVKLNSTVPIVLNKQEKKEEPKDGKKDDKKGKH